MHPCLRVCTTAEPIMSMEGSGLLNAQHCLIARTYGVGKALHVLTWKGCLWYRIPLWPCKASFLLNLL